MFHLVLLQIGSLLSFLVVEQKVKEPQVFQHLIGGEECRSIHVDDEEIVKFGAGHPIIALI